MSISPSPAIFNGGQMTDLPALPSGITKTALLAALMEVVYPGTEAEGVNYQATLAQLALAIGSGGDPTIILSGASYSSVATDSRILVNKTIGSATTISLLGGASYLGPVLVKDLKGDADVNPITITFPGTYDGAASPVTINTQFGWIWFNPLVAGNFYAAD